MWAMFRNPIESRTLFSCSNRAVLTFWIITCRTEISFISTQLLPASNFTSNYIISIDSPLFILERCLLHLSIGIAIKKIFHFLKSLKSLLHTSSGTSIDIRAGLIFFFPLKDAPHDCPYWLNLKIIISFSKSSTHFFRNLTKLIIYSPPTVFHKIVN